METRGLRSAANFGEGRENYGLRQVHCVARGQRSFYATALHKCMAQTPDKALTSIRLINNTKNWSLTVIQRNQRAPSWSATDIATGAINGIKHPSEAGGASLILSLFTDNRILRSILRQYGTHGLLCSLIGLRNGIEPSL